MRPLLIPEEIKVEAHRKSQGLEMLEKKYKIEGGIEMDDADIDSIAEVWDCGEIPGTSWLPIEETDINVDVDVDENRKD